MIHKDTVQVCLLVHYHPCLTQRPQVVVGTEIELFYELYLYDAVVIYKI